MSIRNREGVIATGHRRLPNTLVFLAAAMLVLLLSACTFVIDPSAAEEMPAEAAATAMPEEEPAAMSAEDKIANAMSAGIPSIAADAAVLDYPSEEGAEAVELRTGTNGWRCRPDDPSSPVNDPRCDGPAWLQVAGKAFGPEREAHNGFGFSYMLQGGAAADNDDPSAIEPAAGAEWQVDPPHVMVNSPIQWDPSIYAHDHQAGPWIMFSGTPAEHIMFPIEMVLVEAEAGDDKIANALSAGPTSIREGAAVMDWPSEAGGTLTELRPGTNGWTCLPDDPTNPTNDPTCVDAVWLEWFTEYLAGEEPEVTSVGFAYMLQGGSVADNDDPSVMEPAAGAEWQVDPPHVMIVSPEPLDLTLYSTDHHAGGPWVMFGGTPFEHIMFPITDPIDEHTTGMSDDEKIENVLIGGIPSIVADATILDWPSEEGAAPVELRAGTNGWLCRTDDPITPVNDPRCFDANWQLTNGVAFGPDREAHSELGLAYMLGGGNAADNDDPSVVEPAAGAEWQTDPPHVMINSPIQWDPAVYSTDHHNGGPWIMFSGTPAEHVMFPIEMVPVESEAGDDKIANALSAGPTWLREGAGVIDWPTAAGGEVSELRPGTNGWTCIPDNPGSPTNDPMCLDEQWVEWLTAYLAGEEPEITAVGFAYMLQGGSDTNNADPTLTEPPAGGEWVISPPHVMILSPEPLDLTLHSSDHHEAGPWVMFGGTPYEHIMFPLADPVDGH